MTKNMYLSVRRKYIASSSEAENLISTEKGNL
jgi:hypothetical protein